MTSSSALRTSRRPDGTATSVVAFDDLERRDWDRLLRVTTAATPFSTWTFHRAWWDAYGDGADERYLVVGGEVPLGIVPLMVRSAATGTGRSVYLAASFHADYATALAADDDLADVAAACVDDIAGLAVSDSAIHSADLRRLRAGDGFLAHLEAAAAGRSDGLGWSLRRDLEDVCPTVELAGDWHGQLAGLDKKTRHEVRRKLRRAETRGPLGFRYAALDGESAARFIELHQARWGASGLFAATEDGERSRHFLHRLVELEALEGSAARFHLGEVIAGERVVYMLAGFADDSTCYFYNAGLDPASLELSPGVVGTALYLRQRIEAGDTRFDFLRGDEPYKYAWGASDELIYRLLITWSGDS